MNENAVVRKIRVHGKDEPERNWVFIFDPTADSSQLKELTKHCNIAQRPDMDYTFDAECNGETYHLFSDGDIALVLICMLCIKLDNQSLEAILAANHDDVWKWKEEEE